MVTPVLRTLDYTYPHSCAHSHFTPTSHRKPQSQTSIHHAQTHESLQVCRDSHTALASHTQPHIVVPYPTIALGKPEEGEGTSEFCSRKTVLRDKSYLLIPVGRDSDLSLAPIQGLRTLPAPPPQTLPTKLGNSLHFPRVSQPEQGRTSLASSPEALVQLFYHLAKEPPPASMPKSRSFWIPEASLCNEAWSLAFHVGVDCRGQCAEP